MSSISTYVCFCGTVYDEDTRKPCKGKCGHSLCLECVNLGQKDCPLCEQKDAFVDAKVNYQMLELVIALRDKAEEGFLKNEADNLQSGRCSVCSDNTAKLRICVTCCKSANMVFQNGKDEWVYRKDPRLIFEKALCSSCACENHKEHGHTVIPLDEVVGLPEKELYQRRFERAEHQILINKRVKDHEKRGSQSDHDKTILFYKHVIGVAKTYVSAERPPPPLPFETDFDFKYNIRRNQIKKTEKIKRIHIYKTMIRAETARLDTEDLRKEVKKDSKLKKQLKEMEDICKQLESYKLPEEQRREIDRELSDIVDRHMPNASVLLIVSLPHVMYYQLINAELDEITELMKRIRSMKEVNDDVVSTECALLPLMGLIEKRSAENPSSRRHELFAFSEVEFLTKLHAFFQNQITQVTRKFFIVGSQLQDVHLRVEKVDALRVESFQYYRNQDSKDLNDKLKERIVSVYQWVQKQQAVFLTV